MRRSLLSLFAIPIAAALAPLTGSAQEANLLAVGDEAPDFELRAATRFGIIESPVLLSDFRGKTVVLAFFYRVRTPG